MEPQRLPDGQILIPMRAEDENGLVGDGFCPIGPDHPDYDAWAAEADAAEKPEAADSGGSGAR